jgi:hypothetical protein
VLHSVLEGRLRSERVAFQLRLSLPPPADASSVSLSPCSVAFGELEEAEAQYLRAFKHDMADSLQDMLVRQMHHTYTHPDCITKRGCGVIGPNYPLPPPLTSYHPSSL